MRKDNRLHEEHNAPDLINLSSIWDTLIRATAKYTVRYASDLLIDYESVMKYIRNYDGSEKSFIFGVRTNGVDHAAWVFQAAKEVRRYGKIFQLDVKPYTEYDFADYIKVELWEISYTYDELYNNALCTFAENCKTHTLPLTS